LYKNSIKSIAIGSFDGIHYAHKKLIDEADALVIIERNSGYLTSGFKRSHFTNRECHFYHFDSIKGLEPKAFVSMLSEDFPCLEKIVVGYDFHFGKNKSGNAEMLRSLCDIEVMVIDEVYLKGISVHSRTIKNTISLGNIVLANTFLGRDYHIEGKIISGQGLGKTSLVPTLNLEVEEYILPLAGVYATLTVIDEMMYESVSFLGHRVSTDGSYAIETHILDEDLGELQGKIKLVFKDFLRANQKFESLESLKAQIKEDIAKAKEVLYAQR
jgi:riboflavin kinase/FMN adenylyltransferase